MEWMVQPMLLYAEIINFFRDRSKSSSCEAVENRTAGILKRYAEERKHKTNETDGLFQRSQGSILVLAAIAVTALIGFSAVAVDIGTITVIKGKAKVAADAAALAGAMRISNLDAAEEAVFSLAQKNGFTNGENNTTVTMQVNPTGENANWVSVSIQTTRPFSFGKIFGLNTQTINASSIAEFNAFVPLDINLGGTYGYAPGLVNLFNYGPYQRHSYGDAYSTKYLDDRSNNPDYGEGYNFQINIPENYRDLDGTKIVQIEIFDPDTYNSGGQSQPNGSTRIDQILNPFITDSGYTSKYNKTVYSLYAPDDTPYDYQDDVLIATSTYQNSSSTDMKWTTPSGYNFNTQNYGTGNYRLNVNTIDGSSGNGYELRAGPPNYARNKGKEGYLSDGFDPNNGTVVMASGKLPISFNDSGQTTILFGEVPEEVAGKKLYIDKFDTDIDAQSIIYTCDSIAGQSWQGTLAGNDEWERDAIDVPSNYTPGNWFGTYNAGYQDTSVWMMTYDGYNSGSSGIVRLVQ
jgi:hypothetical protein